MRASALLLSRLSLLSLGLACVSCGGDEAAASGPEIAGFLRNSGTVQAAESVAPPADAPPAESAAGEHAADADTPQPSAPALVSADPGDGSALERRAAAWLESGDHARAAVQLSELLLAEIAGSSDDRAAIARLAALLRRAQAGHRWNVKGAWPSFDVGVQSGDSLIAIRKRALATHPDLLLCTGLIARANQLRSETAIRPGDVLRIPTARAAVIVDLSAMWAFYTLGGEVADAWEVGVGKDGSDTQPGTYTIGLKQQNPMWSPVGREPVAFGDPANPLGTRWLAWHLDGRSTTLGFHGTNDPSGVGRRVSEGCIRMRNPDVEALYDVLPQGAEVRVQP